MTDNEMTMDDVREYLEWCKAWNKAAEEQYEKECQDGNLHANNDPVSTA